MFKAVLERTVGSGVAIVYSVVIYVFLTDQPYYCRAASRCGGQPEPPSKQQRQGRNQSSLARFMTTAILSTAYTNNKQYFTSLRSRHRGASPLPLRTCYARLIAPRPICISQPFTTSREEYRGPTEHAWPIAFKRAGWPCTSSSTRARGLLRGGQAATAQWRQKAQMTASNRLQHASTTR